MKRLLFILAAIVAVCSTSFGEVYVYSNRVTHLSPSAHPLTFNTEWPARYTVYSRNASWTANSLANHTVWWAIIDVRDNEEVTRFPVEIRDATNGHAVANVSFKGFEPGQYLGQMMRYLSETNYDGLIASDFITLYTPCEGCGVSNTVNVGAQTFITTNVFQITATTVVEGVTVVMTNLVTVTNAITVNFAPSNTISVANTFSPTNNYTINLDNITSEVIYYMTGAVTSVQGATGDVVLAVVSATNPVGYLAWSNTTLIVGTNTAGLGGGASIWQEAGGVISPTNDAAEVRGNIIRATNRIVNGSSHNRVDAPRSGIGAGGATTGSSSNFVDGTSSDSWISGGTENQLFASPQSSIGAGIRNKAYNSPYTHMHGDNLFFNLVSQGGFLGSSIRGATGTAVWAVGGYMGMGATQSVMTVLLGDQHRVGRTTNATPIGTMVTMQGGTNLIGLGAVGYPVNTTSNNQILLAARSFLLITPNYTTHMDVVVMTNYNPITGATNRYITLGALLP